MSGVPPFSVIFYTKSEILTPVIWAADCRQFLLVSWQFQAIDVSIFTSSDGFGVFLLFKGKND